MGGYMLFNNFTNTIVAGSRFDLGIKHVGKFLNGD